MGLDIGGTAVSTSYNPVANALRLMKRNARVIKVGLLGDSLVAGAGQGPTYWYNYLFDEAQRASGYSLLNDFSISTNGIAYDNYAVGGQTSDLMLCHVVPQASCQHADGVVGDQISLPLYTIPPAIAKQYDFVIIDGGQNGGQYNALFIEEIVRRFIETGTEVILLSTQREKNASSPPTWQADYQKIAAHYGCYLIDMDNEYYLASGGSWTYAFANYYYDTIHPTILGHQIWANAFRKVLNPNNVSKATKTTTGQLPMVRLYYFTEGDPTQQGNYSWYFMNLPPTTTGTTQAIPAGGQQQNPVATQGLTQQVSLANGQYAQFAFDDALFWVPVWSGQNAAATVDIYPNGAGAVQASLVLAADYIVAKTLNTVPYTTYNQSQPNYAGSRTVKLQVSSGGPIALSGVLVCSAVPYIRLKGTGTTMPNGVTLTGTWSSSAWETVTDYAETITNGDEVDVFFTGTSITGILGLCNGGGLIDAYMDGVKLETYDTYSGAANLSFHSRKWKANGFGPHKLRLVVNGANASAQAPLMNVNPRLSFREFYVHNDEPNLTERWSLLKNWSA